MSFVENSNYPTQLDSESNLFLVKDSAKTSLTQVFNPTDTTISVDSTSGFPDVGIITLIGPQEEDITTRACSLLYTGKTETTFTGLSSMPFSTPTMKEIGSLVVMNVRAEHHNQIASALMAMEAYVGTAHGESDTLQNQLNQLVTLIPVPIAMFNVSVGTGLANQTEFQFEDASFGSPTSWIWNFGDGGTSLEENPTHIYTTPGVYDVTLTVSNGYGTDTITLVDIVSVMDQPPQNALVAFSVDKALVGSIVWVTASADTAPGNPISTYAWYDGTNDQDPNDYPSQATVGMVYERGGLYYIHSKIITLAGNYAWAKHLVGSSEVPLDIVEMQNLWHLIMDEGTTLVRSYELGLISLTYKVGGRQTFDLQLDTAHLYSPIENHLMSKGFVHLNNFEHAVVWTPAGAIISVAKLNTLLDSWSSEVTWQHPKLWNWTVLDFYGRVYVLQGTTDEVAWLTTDNELAIFDAEINTWTSINLPDSAYLDAWELKNYPDTCPTGYRACTKEGLGYIIRTRGPLTDREFTPLYVFDPTSNVWVEKANIPSGLGLSEGQITPLVDGIYMFWNSAHILRYDTLANVWVIANQEGDDQWHSLQDTEVPGYDSPSASLLVASDNNTKAFLSFDYSASAFIYFNQVSSTFQKYTGRPVGDQWQMLISTGTS